MRIDDLRPPAPSRASEADNGTSTSVLYLGTQKIAALECRSLPLLAEQQQNRGLSAVTDRRSLNRLSSAARSLTVVDCEIAVMPHR
jgi:hypothetical protein